jgi:hypothetical protein
MMVIIIYADIYPISGSTGGGFFANMAISLLFLRMIPKGENLSFENIQKSGIDGEYMRNPS